MCIAHTHDYVVLLCLTNIYVISCTIVLTAQEKEAPAQFTDTCLTNGCVKSSADLLRNMDLSVKPCDDFYNFACGNFIKKAKIAHDKTYVNTFTIINDLLQEQLRTALEEPIQENELTPFKNVKKYYKACTNKGKNVLFINQRKYISVFVRDIDQTIFIEKNMKNNTTKLNQ